MPHDQRDEEVIARNKQQIPRKYKVILYNDDYTPMQLVTTILTQVFHLTQAASTRITLTIHNTGVGVAGVYTKEIAETKVHLVMQIAQKAGFPLYADLEPE